MPETFRFLDLPIELQLCILEQSIPAFTIKAHGQNSYQNGDHAKMRVQVAGPKALHNLVWVPRQLRGNIAQAVISRFDGRLNCSTGVLHYWLNPKGFPNMPWRAIKVIELTSSVSVSRCDIGPSLATRWPSLVSAFDNRYLTGLTTVRADVFEEYQYSDLLCLHHDVDGSLFLEGTLDDEVKRWMSGRLEEIRRNQTSVLCWKGRERLKLELEVNVVCLCADAKKGQITCWIVTFIQTKNEMIIANKRYRT